jgi:hypothetical protein
MSGKKKPPAYSYDPSYSQPAGTAKPSGSVSGDLAPAPEHPDHAAIRENAQALSDKLTGGKKR